MVSYDFRLVFFFFYFSEEEMEILLGIEINLSFGGVEIFTPLILTIRKYGMSFHFRVSLSLS